MRRRTALLTLALTAALAAAPPASASLRDEVRAGQALAQKLEAGTTTCDRLTTDELEHLGEYVMERMVGSPRLHGVMNQRMSSVIGTENETRMHVLMGRRYAGCPAAGSAGPMMGGSGWRADQAWHSMMAAGGWDWMRDGSWQHMSRADWERAGELWMGPGTMHAVGDGWHVADIALLAAGLALAAGLVAALVAATSRRRRAAAS
jgi:hypothetical protein